MDRSEWQALNALSICRTLVAGFFWLFTPLYMLSAHLGAADIGLVIGIATLVRLFSAPLVGTLNDLLGTRRLIQISLAGMALGAALLGFTEPATLSFLTVLWPMCLFLLSSNSLMLSLEASLYKKTTETEVAGHVGEYNAFKAVAWGIGILVSGYLLLTFSFNTLAFVLAVFCMLALAITFLVKHTVKVQFDLSQYANELAKPAVLMLSMIILIQSFEWGNEGVALGPLLHSQGGLDSSQIGIVTFAADIVMGAVSIWAGHRVSSRHRGAQPKEVRWVLIAGLLFAAGGSFLIFVTHDMQGMMAARILYNIGEVLNGVSIGFLIGTTFSQTRVGGVNGVLNLISNVGMASAAFAAAYLMAFGFGVPYLVSGALFLFAAAAVWFLFKRL